MTYTLGQAAKATGKNKATIFQAIKSGRISAAKDDFGRYMIDPAELHRLYSPVSNNVEVEVATIREQPPENGKETDFLREKIELLERLISQMQSENDTLKRMLPPPQTALPAAQFSEAQKPANRGIFGWLRGRAA